MTQTNSAVPRWRRAETQGTQSVRFKRINTLLIPTQFQIQEPQSLRPEPETQRHYQVRAQPEPRAETKPDQKTVMQTTSLNTNQEISDKAEMRGKIILLEAALLALPQIEIPIKHYFAPGLYLREMQMPKDAIITGKIHKTEHYCVLSKGSVLVANDEGTKTYHAPAVIHSMPGTKRALHALSDVVWVNCHHNPTNETDTDKIEDVFVVDTFEKFLSFTEQKRVEGGE